MDELRQAAERAEAATTLLTARDALQAQRLIGPDIAVRKREVDLLDQQLAAEERRAILRQSLQDLNNALSTSAVAPDATTLREALINARNLLNTHGLDTRAIDSALEGNRWGRE
jgi:hypothetical protein